MIHFGARPALRVISTLREAAVDLPMSLEAAEVLRIVHEQRPSYLGLGTVLDVQASGRTLRVQRAQLAIVRRTLTELLDGQEDIELAVRRQDPEAVAFARKAMIGLKRMIRALDAAKSSRSRQ